VFVGVSADELALLETALRSHEATLERNNKRAAAVSKLDRLGLSAMPQRHHRCHCRRYRHLFKCQWHLGIVCALLPLLLPLRLPHRLHG